MIRQTQTWLDALIQNGESAMQYDFLKHFFNVVVMMIGSNQLESVRF